MTRRLIALFRAARLALHIGYGLVLAVAYPWFGMNIRRRILQNWSASLLHIFNVRIDIAGDDPLHRLRQGLIVTNHISWLDVFVLNAVVPMRFVAKSEVRRWPVIGWLCARAQTLFIERGKARSAARINVQLVELLQRGECLAVFPEGTTTDGTAVAHFHSSLLQPAIDAGSLVHPVAIRYLDADGGHSTAAAYIDDLSFGASMWSILGTPQLHVRLIATPPLNAGELDRRSLTQKSHDRISSALRMAASPNFHIPVTPAQHSESNLLPSTR
ncbi:MAG: 1-acyl-sn-glycerol-3-phosphate acyltransferase [Nitrosomonadales bacterium]|nr:1-acyl-sn-glycerol-3-phosphate acyltransferase [Nitrosomonadales bacterium]